MGALLTVCLWLVVLAGGAGAAQAVSFSWSAPYGLDRTGGEGLSGVACPSSTQCTAVDSNGGEVTFDPTSSTPTSTVHTVDSNPGGRGGGQDLNGVACPSSTQCTAVGGNGGEVTFDPTSSTPNSTLHTVDSGQFLHGVACPSSTQCTAVGGNGGEVTFDPTSSTPNSTVHTVDSDLSGVACPSSTQCTAVGGNGGEVTFDPTSSTPNSTVHTVVDSNPGGRVGGLFPFGVACPSSTQCTAVDEFGGEVTFDPTSSTPNSTVHTVDSGQGLTGVACPSSTQCTAVDEFGGEVTFDPTSSTPNSTVHTVDSGQGLTGVACPSVSECVAVDDLGNGFTGTAVAAAPPAPTVSGVSPSEGPAAGGSSVTITGTNLQNASAVDFGTTSVTSFTSDATGQIVLNSPAHAAGTVDVTVLTAGGTSATSTSDQFTYVSAPSVSGVSPSSGSTAGGTSVTITGTNLQNASAVDFGTAAVSSFTSDTAGQIVLNSPAYAAGTVDVTVVTAGGTSGTSASDQFTFVPPPPPPPPGAVSSASGSSSRSSWTASASNAGTSVSAVGVGSLTVSQYASAPYAPPALAGEFFDVQVASGSSFSTLTIQDCSLNGGTRLQWWDGSAWTAVSPQSYQPGPPACVTATLGSSSSPTIAQLTGTVFAVAASTPIPAVAELGHASVTGTTVSVPVSCTGSSGTTCQATLTLSVVETLKGRRATAVAAAKPKPARTTKKLLTLGRASVRIAAGQSQTVRITLNSTGKRLLAARHCFKAKLTLTQAGATAASTIVTFTAKTKTRAH